MFPGFYEHGTSSSRRDYPPYNNEDDDSDHILDKEHMFDKIVTPSDVGKLNRLVIPKQYAEKYFPLDSSANDKGLLLNFEDSNGKPWLFRYSYWNSSQSYVITKGWSSFVKEKNLDAGDVVSFYRGKDRLFIHGRRRPNLPPPIPKLSLHHHYSRPLFASHHRRHSYGPYYSGKEETAKEMVKVVHGKAVATAKKLRLFGVNVDCANTVSDKCDRLPTTLSLSSSTSITHPPNYNHKGKSVSISLDLNLFHL